MGLSNSKTKTKSSSTGTATTTPNVPDWIQTPAQGFYGQVGGMLNRGPGAVSDLTAQAMASAGGLGANQGMGDAMNATRGLLNFAPGSVQAGQLRDTDLSGYMNPYEDQVVGNSLRDLDRFRQGAITSNQGSATMSGAYGGSRHGVADSETNRGFIDQAGSLAAGLRQAGYNNAQQGAMFDINNRFSADQFNSTQDLAGAGLRLGAANQLGQQGLGQDANTRANIGTQAALGEGTDPIQRQIAYLRQISELLGINPGQFIGQTINQSGSSSGTQTTGTNWMDVIGSLAQAAGTAAASDRRLKRAIVPLDDTINGTPLYEFEYLWDEPGVKTIGVMADEAPPHAVIMHPSGYAMVDYASL